MPAWIRRIPLCVLCVLSALLLTSAAAAQSSGALDESQSEMRPLIERYAADRSGLSRRYRAPMSSNRRERMRRFQEDWLRTIEALPFEEMSREGRIDWLLLRNLLKKEIRALATETRRDEAVLALLPFAGAIVELEEARQRMEDVDPRRAAEIVDGLALRLELLQKEVRQGSFGDTNRTIAKRAVSRIESLRRTLRAWYRHWAGYDPVFTWWVGKPWEHADRALGSYAGEIGKRLVKAGGDDMIGDPIGRAELIAALESEWIPYSPEELIRIARRELAWCDAEMEKAARELGEEDWRKAQERVKTLHVGPGEQPKLVRDLAREAIDFIAERDLVTVPPLCREIWRLSMMSPERQKMSPYFLGGETILVAFPTDEMEHRDKLMSMRGNNPHFIRAVVHHELIPGHHLQGFMAARHRTYRRPFGTPFYLEGWALYWEMVLWDLEFPKSPEDRIGMLFWRKHRCARIIFSLSYHLEEMTAKEAVGFLVDRVGHERNNAEAEVRRSVSGGYAPLYQAAYMLGGLQLRALHEEIVGAGKMTDREFHDAVLMENNVPIELIRADLTGAELTRDFRTTWRFYDLEEDAPGKDR